MESQTWKEEIKVHATCFEQHTRWNHRTSTICKLGKCNKTIFAGWPWGHAPFSWPAMANNIENLDWGRIVVYINKIVETKSLRNIIRTNITQFNRAVTQGINKNFIWYKYELLDKHRIKNIIIRL